MGRVGGIGVDTGIGMPLRHHTLVAWQRADDLFVDLHKLALNAFPSHEKFELGSQLRRAAFSVAANIVEGCAREHTKERLQFLQTARASLAEVGYCLHVAKRLGYIGDAELESKEVAIRRASAALGGFMQAVREGRAT
jgi:four helix bundle protein